jgi:hypothetical protein
MARTQFFIAPFHMESGSQISRKAEIYEDTRRRMAEFNRKTAGEGGMPVLLRQYGIGEGRKFGTIVSVERLMDAFMRDPTDSTTNFLWGLMQASDPREVLKSHKEALALVKQLHDLGHDVFVQDHDDPARAKFVSAARMAGADVIEPTEREQSEREERSLLSGLYSGFAWARDQHVKIDDSYERPIKDFLSLARGVQHMFGEGGGMLQVAPKGWLVLNHVLSDPRVLKYAKNGHDFHPMPNGLQYDTTFSQMFGTPFYNSVPHLDFNLGAVPEKKVLAVCPHYYSENEKAVDLAVRHFGLTKVMVPEEEASRHPAGFLPLGNGAALVDSGAPKFIARLRKAGVKVVPTALPLDSMIVNKATLHCLFNEL